MRESRIQKTMLGCCLFVAAAFLIIFSLITWTGRATLCDSDMYCDQLVARLIWENKSVFPDNWAFGNQYNVISTPVIMALFYGLTGDMNLSMVLGCTVMNLLIVAAFWWALRPFFSGLQLSLSLMTLLGCIICNSAATVVDGQFLYVMANYYACYLIVLLIVWGDWIRLLSGKRKSLISVSFIFSVVLSFLIGMQSIRQFLMMILPMAALEVLRILVQKIQKKGEKFCWTPTLAVLCFGAANLLGYFFVKSLNINTQSIYGSCGMRPASEWLQMIKPAIQNVLQISGMFDLIRNDMQPLSVILWVLTLVLIGWAGIRALMHLFKQDAVTPEDILVMVSAVSILGVFAVNILIRMDVRPLYYFTWIPLTAFSALSVFRCLKDKWKLAFTAILCVLLLNNLFYSYGSSLENAENVDTVRQDMAQWVMDHDYKYIYGNWDEANTVAAYGDGSFLAASWFLEPFRILPYTNMTDVYTEAHNEQAVYLITAHEEEQARKFLDQNHITLELQASFEDGFYKLYTSPCQLMH